MALDFGKQNQMTAEEIQETTPQLTLGNEVEVYDIQAERQALTKNLVGSQEVDDIVSSIEVYNMETVVSFGAEVAEEISKASDIVLNSMNMDQLEKSNQMLVSLGKIMDQFDLDEIKDEPGLFGKIFNNAKKQLEKILNKYNTMGNEVDKIYVELKTYESEITHANRRLDDMFQANVAYYHKLVKYILAGEQAIAELTDYVAEKNAELASSGDNALMFEVQGLQQTLMLLEQRTHDLRIAENVALQSVPMIKTMEFTNMNLVRKINSAFIITLPVFKQALAQAIMLKRQKIQSEALSALDEKTNELLLKNAQNTVEQSKMTAQMASGSSIKIETLEKSWKTIVTGIEETRRIQENAHNQRNADKARLETMKQEFEAMTKKAGN